MISEINFKKCKESIKIYVNLMMKLHKKTRILDNYYKTLIKYSKITKIFKDDLLNYSKITHRISIIITKNNKRHCINSIKVI
jgi:hypothetical protein